MRVKGRRVHTCTHTHTYIEEVVQSSVCLDTEKYAFYAAESEGRGEGGGVERTESKTFI